MNDFTMVLGTTKTRTSHATFRKKKCCSHWCGELGRRPNINWQLEKWAAFSKNKPIRTNLFN